MDLDEIEDRLDALEAQNEKLQAQNEQLQEKADAAETRADDAEQRLRSERANRIVTEYSDRIPSSEEAKYREMAANDPEQVQSILEDMDAPDVTDEHVQRAETKDEAPDDYDEMHVFDDHIGRDDEGRMVATNDEDVKVFERAGLDYVRK